MAFCHAWQWSPRPATFSRIPIFAGARAAALLLAFSLHASLASAHPLAPALLDLHERKDGRVEVAWKIPSMRVRGSRIDPVLPPDCKPTGGAPEVLEGVDSVTMRWSVQCPEGGLAGKRIGVQGLETSQTDALLRIELAGGRLVRSVLRADEPFLTVPEEPSSGGVLTGYIRLGFDHILEGIDHLLFVFGLMMLASSTRLLVETITAFTIGHSITLTLAALDLARIPSAPVDALIALSIFLLAVELTRGKDLPPSLMRRFPWLMAGLFGMLHGLGFAGALREIGLPEGDVPLALFSFNVGIELGQLVFVAAVLVGGRLLARALARRPSWTDWVPIYAMGSLSAYWVLDRVARLLR